MVKVPGKAPGNVSFFPFKDFVRARATVPLVSELCLLWGKFLDHLF